ncbi:ParA family protein [Costertonia aggregata]|uniref:ParA family protein n=1 Tax=Costertonia aggregata TaxID=343403 RepID=A0A7H9AT15_9FLAO|nr:ParA family protein [Costertonia aggregata]QLG46589.1 ParA family protein [Costertonia aggregata]
METKIISCTGEKGGCGKTTLNIILATNLFHLYGKKVVLMDMDNPQYSVYKKRKRDLAQIGKMETDAFPVERATIHTLEPLIKKYYGIVDFIIIDFPGNLNEEMVRGLLYVEHIFIPFFLDELEIDSTAVFYKTLRKNFLDNDNRVLRSVNLFFNRYELVKVNKFNAVRKTLARAGMPMMRQVVMERTIYREKYRNTLVPIPLSKENGEQGLKRFMEEVLEISKN